MYLAPTRFWGQSFTHPRLVLTSFAFLRVVMVARGCVLWRNQLRQVKVGGAKKSRRHSKV
ncbi:hypothetical protein M0657_005716 [Pyricularia oryzae]|nr:hypothetical protein M9X92_009162 [Pyricularia oryzae]KAI7922299.1 hypothetical protein M0657_005716 [Pyricularia oryzae]